jgi:hypothetical protein
LEAEETSRAYFARTPDGYLSGGLIQFFALSSNCSAPHRLFPTIITVIEEKKSPSNGEGNEKGHVFLPRFASLRSLPVENDPAIAYTQVKVYKYPCCSRMNEHGYYFMLGATSSYE